MDCCEGCTVYRNVSQSDPSGPGTHAAEDSEGAHSDVPSFVNITWVPHVTLHISGRITFSNSWDSAIRLADLWDQPLRAILSCPLLYCCLSYHSCFLCRSSTSATGLCIWSKNVLWRRSCGVIEWRWSRGQTRWTRHNWWVGGGVWRCQNCSFRKSAETGIAFTVPASHEGLY